MAVIRCALCDKLVDMDWHEVFEYNEFEFNCESCEDNKDD